MYYHDLLTEDRSHARLLHWCKTSSRQSASAADTGCPKISLSAGHGTDPPGDGDVGVATSCQSGKTHVARYGIEKIDG